MSLRKYNEQESAYDRLRAAVRGKGGMTPRVAHVLNKRALALDGKPVAVPDGMQDVSESDLTAAERAQYDQIVALAKL